MFRPHPGHLQKVTNFCRRTQRMWQIVTDDWHTTYINVKVKQSHYRPGQAQRVPGG